MSLGKVHRELEVLDLLVVDEALLLFLLIRNLLAKAARCILKGLYILFIR